MPGSERRQLQLVFPNSCDGRTFLREIMDERDDDDGS